MQQLVELKSFPRVVLRKKLRYNFLKYIYSLISNNSFFFNLYNKHYIALQKSMGLSNTTDLTRDLIVQLRKHGVAFLRVEDFFDVCVYEELKESFSYHCDQFFKLPDVNKKNKGKGVYLKTIYKDHIFKKNDIISTYCGSETIARIASKYFNMLARYVGCSFWHTVVSQKKGDYFSQRWHRDHNDRMILKTFLHLSDVGHDQGGLEYITQSHIDSMYPVGYELAADGRLKYPEQRKIQKLSSSLKKIYVSEYLKPECKSSEAPWANESCHLVCDAPEGTLIFADTSGLHRGGDVKQGHRDVIMLTYSTNYNIRESHFNVSKPYAESLNPFMAKVLGIT